MPDLSLVALIVSIISDYTVADVRQCVGIYTHPRSFDSGLGTYGDDSVWRLALIVESRDNLV